MIGVLAHAAGLIPQAEAISAKELATVFSWEKMEKENIFLDMSLLS